jgi:hypothetical protein
MTVDFEIKSNDELCDYIEAQGREVSMFDYQLKTNLAFIYELSNNETVMLSGSLNYDGIIFYSKSYFLETLRKDEFPIANPEKDLFEYEKERIINIHQQVDFYKSYLNEKFKLGFSEITKESALVYLKKIVGRTIRKMSTDTDVVALIAIFGELIRKETNGKWIL